MRVDGTFEHAAARAGVQRAGELEVLAGHVMHPVLGLVENLGLHGTTLSFVKIYVGILGKPSLSATDGAPEDPGAP